jgi:hypothetical protein
VSLQIQGTEIGIVMLVIAHEHLRYIDHKQREVNGIGHGSLGDIHEIFQTPELFGVPEIGLDLESQAVIVNQQIVR